MEKYIRNELQLKNLTFDIRSHTYWFAQSVDFELTNKEQIGKHIHSGQLTAFLKQLRQTPDNRFYFTEETTEYGDTDCWYSSRKYFVVKEEIAKFFSILSKIRDSKSKEEFEQNIARFLSLEIEKVATVVDNEIVEFKNI